MLAVQVNIFMVILLFSIAVHEYLKFDRKDQIHRLFFALTVSTIVILILEILSVLLNSGSYRDLIVWHKLVDTAGFTLAPLVPVLALLYVYKRTNRYIRIKISKYLWLCVPVLVNTIFSVGSYQYNWIFGITAENVYVRGPLFFISPLSVLFYHIAILLFLYDSRRKINREELFALSLLSIIPTVMSVFQLHYFIYLTIWNSVAISLVINYIFILHNQTKIDPLTGLGNRLAYDEYIANLGKRGNLALSVVNIDLDDFKSINNLYGHHEGDNVLRVFARELKTAFEGIGEPNRVGGDEFIVWIRENNKEVLDKHINILTDRINAYNDTRDLPYRISFSCGMTTFDKTYNNIHELVQHSDKLMYEEKQKKQEIFKMDAVV